MINPITVNLLSSVLSSSGARKLFASIANQRIAKADWLKASNPQADQDLGALTDADLIAAAGNGESYYVTAKGLKVARDLEQLVPVG